MDELKKFFSRGSGDTVQDLCMCLRRMGRIDIVHEGWLTKKGKVVKNWKKRYFLMVSPGYLIYCENSDMIHDLKQLKVFHGPNADEEEIRKIAECAIELGVIGSIRVCKETQVNRVGTLEGHDNVFSIKAPEPSNRVFFLSAESPAEISKWESMIRFMDHFETRQREKEEEEQLKREEKNRERIKAKYRQLLPKAKDMYQGGVIRCNEEVWTYESRGPGDEQPALIECTQGKSKGLNFTWNGTVVSDGQVAMMGDDIGGWGLWNGARFEWRTPACLDRRGRGQAYEYKPDDDWKTWRASDFTRKLNFPKYWEFVDSHTLKPFDYQMQDIPAVVNIEGSVPPMVALAVGMHSAGRREAEWQVKILREIQAEEREKRALKEQIEKKRSV